MTDGRMALLELTGKQADTDLVRDMLACAAGRIMEVGLRRWNRAPARRRACARRCAGSSTTDTESGAGWRRIRKRSGGPFPRRRRAGRIALEIPELRRGSHFPGFPEPRRTAGKALVAVIQEACVQGIRWAPPVLASDGPPDRLLRTVRSSGPARTPARALGADRVNESARTGDPRDQAAGRCHRDLFRRRRHHMAGRDADAGDKRRMGRGAAPYVA